MYPAQKDAGALEKSLRRCFASADDLLLLCLRDSTITGVMALYVDKANRYIESGGWYTQDATAHRSAYDYIAAAYPAHTFDFGLSQANASALRFISEHVEAPLDRCSVMTLSAADAPPAVSVPDGCTVTGLTGHAAEFVAFHDRHNPDSYWTGARIMQDTSRWLVHLLVKEGTVVASVTSSLWDKQTAEIFSLSGDDPLAQSCLMRSHARAAFAAGRKQLLFFAAEGESKIAHDAGFTKTDDYLCYRTFL